jgi:effector-binding domain-containing protein
MLDAPRILRTDAHHAAVIRFTIPRAEMSSVMGPGIAEVMATVAAQGLAPSGPVFTHHFRIDPAVFDFEVGVPVASPVAPAGRVVAGELPEATVARTAYHGPYEGLGPAWREFDAWFAAQGHAPAGGRWECYLAGPESGADPSAWRTELNRPLASVA